MKRMLVLGALMLGSALSPAFAGAGPIKIVLPEEADLLEPCMATRSNIGRVILQNVSETLTELDVRGDKGVIDRFGPDGAAWVVVKGAAAAKKVQSGYLYSYALIMLLGLVAAITWVLM